jgi:hypothetical protein
VPAFGQLVDVFLLHPFGDLDKSVETGAQSSLQPVYALSTAGNRINRKGNTVEVSRKEYPVERFS